MEKVELEIVGLTSGHSQKSSYTLILGEAGSQTKIPVVIGAFEAQAIALFLEKIKPQRPLTHDLFTSFAKNFDIRLKEVMISDLVEGIFFSKLICERKGEGGSIEIDARTSDAVALAIRFGCPIFTKRSILENAGIIMEDDVAEDPERPEEDMLSYISASSDYEDLSLEELHELLDEAIQVEDYDKAALLRDEIKKRK